MRKVKKVKKQEISRNDPCWCGSEKKYKVCHEAFDRKYQHMKNQHEQMPPRKLIKNEEDLHWIREAAKINTAVLDEVEKTIHEGMSTEDIDKLVHDFTVEHGGIPAPLGYNGYPKSVCTSINEEVCHGIPDPKRILKNGDIINVDCTTIVNGHYADASRMFIIGEASEKAKKLVEVTRECLQAGIDAVEPWGHLGDIGAAIQKLAHENGYSVVTDFCGHGVGNGFHEDPLVAHVGQKGRGMVLAPGMVFTIEPMINEGGPDLYIDEDNGWTAITEDGKLSAQWEVTLAVHEDGIEIITH